MLKLVDRHGLGPCAERRGGSIPLSGTEHMTMIETQKKFSDCTYGELSTGKTLCEFYNKCSGSDKLQQDLAQNPTVREEARLVRGNSVRFAEACIEMGCIYPEAMRELANQFPETPNDAAATAVSV